MPINFDSDFWKNCWTYKRGAQDKLKAGILAAGLGKRMDPLTVRHLPKPLFPLGGKIPMAEIWIRRLVEAGIVDISMNLCDLSATIKRHFQDGSKFAAQISYVEERTPTGTLGGACKQALGSRSKRVLIDEEENTGEAFKGSTIIIPSGDIVTNFGSELLEKAYEIHQRAGAAFSMVLVPVPWERRQDYGTVVLDRPEAREGILSQCGRIGEFREKDAESPSNLNNASIYMIEMDLIKALDPLRTPADLQLAEPFYDFGKHVFPAMLGNIPYIKLPTDYPLWGIRYDGKWFDVGQKRDYLRVNEYLLDRELNIDLPYERLPWGYLGANVAIDFSRVEINPPVIIGNDCIIEAGARLGPYAVIGDGWIIESETQIRNSVLWERYSYFNDTGTEISAKERRLVDRHEVRKGAIIEECIVAGGAIQGKICEKTIDVLESGEHEILPIDHIPVEPRA